MSDEPGRRPRRRRWWVRLCLSCARIWLLLCVAVFFLQRRLMYFPDGAAVPLPAAQARAGLREVELRAADGTSLRAWEWPGTRAVTALLFHGNAGHRGHRLAWIAALHDAGLGVFALDWRGYGGSEGTPTEAGLYADASAARDWVAARRPQDVLVYCGESLGSAVAVDLAVRHPPAALVLHGSFSSALDVARRAFPFLPAALLMRDRFAAADRIAGLRCPLLVFHGDRDRVIPIDLGRALWEGAPQPKEWRVVAGAGHDDLLAVAGDEYVRRVAALVP